MKKREKKKMGRNKTAPFFGQNFKFEEKRKFSLKKITNLLTKKIDFVLLFSLLAEVNQPLIAILLSELNEAAASVI